MIATQSLFKYVHPPTAWEHYRSGSARIFGQESCECLREVLSMLDQGLKVVLFPIITLIEDFEVREQRCNTTQETDNGHMDFNWRELWLDKVLDGQIGFELQA